VELAPKLTWSQIKCHYEGIDNDITQGMLAAKHKVHTSIQALEVQMISWTGPASQKHIFLSSQNFIWNP
jgi:hypothetical protein